MEMIELIKQKLNNEENLGIIPLSPKRLKLKFAKKSFAPGFDLYIIMFLICLLPSIFLYGFPAFILADIGVSIYSKIIVYILILGFIIYLADFIYVNKIKKYPEVFLIVVHSGLHCIVIKNNQIQLHHRFSIDNNRFNEIFYGDYNRKKKQIGEYFEIKQNDKSLIEGKLSISKNQFYCNAIDTKYLLPMDKFKKLFLL